MIKTIYIDKQLKNNCFVKSFLQKNKLAAVKVLDGGLNHKVNSLSFEEGKRTVVFAKSKGRLLKICPGLGEPYLCCRLYVLNLISNCPMSCSYCFLQFYLNNPAITIYPELRKAKEELKKLSFSNPNRLFRITTGELSDSLFFDRDLNFSKNLIQIVEKYPNLVFELKTKTAKVNHLLEAASEKVVISWSLNPSSIARNQETGTASLKKRLEAAKKCQEAGFLVAFHFDPVIYFEGWGEDYQRTIKTLFREIDSERVAWVSVGTLRFAPDLPFSRLPYGEFVKAKDGKMRYFKPLRIKIYREIAGFLRNYASDKLFYYLCMEMPDAWKALGFVPQSQLHLDYLFAKSLHERYGLFKKPRVEDYLDSTIAGSRRLSRLP